MKVHEVKYSNSSWLDVVRMYNPELADGVSYLHTSICLADDIADRAISPQYVTDGVLSGLMGISICYKQGFGDEFLKALSKIAQSEKQNLDFVPGQKSMHEELVVWELRSSYLDIFFLALCCADPSFKTEANEKWFEEFKAFCLIQDDCTDLTTDTFEDLIQCRRNYVVLTEFGFDGYVGWQDKKEELKSAAKKVSSSLILSDPIDSRMKIFMRSPDA